MLSNPYPCDINWDSETNWTKPVQMQNSWHRWNSSGSGYGLYANGAGYLGALPAPTNPNIIPSGQGFFVLLESSGSATLQVREAAKITSASASFSRNATVGSRVKILLTKSLDPSAYGYNTMIRFQEGATDGYDMNLDFSSLGGNRFNISVPTETSNMAVATFPLIENSKSIPLNTNYQGEFGDYILKFSEMEDLVTSSEVYLKDNLFGSITPVGPEMVYNYTVSATDGVIFNRFELVFSPLTITNIKGAISKGFEVFPNPGNGNEIQVRATSMKGEVGQIVITDMLGKEILSRQINLPEAGVYLGSLKLNLSSGMYTIELRTQKEVRKRPFIVR